MPQPNLKRAVLIAGPTASGKSALALRLAAEENGVIINADSMQVYRELQIITARPSAAEEAQVPHQLYGHVSAAEPYSTGHWQKQAVAAIESVLAQGKLPILCGGTGLYFNALIKGLVEVPEIAPELRAYWRAYAGNLHAALAERDAASAARLHPSDRQRLIRALEVVEGTGMSLPEWQARCQAKAPLQGFSLRRLFKCPPREELYARADTRFDQMLEQGALQEIQALPTLPPTSPLLKAIGVPELAAVQRGDITLDQARNKAQTATRHYIKRQLTWWRGQMQGWDVIA